MNKKPLKHEPTATKKVVKKTAAKKSASKKTVAKKSAAAKPVKVAKKTAKVSRTRKKVVAKTVKAAPATTIVAKIDVGFGNQLFIRGNGADLNWDRGIELDNTAPNEWRLTSGEIQDDIECKFLINDRVWSSGDNLTLKAGGELVFEPTFS